MKKVTLYQAVCVQPMCPGGHCKHCFPHPFDEKECNKEICDISGEPFMCKVIKMESFPCDDDYQTTNIRDEDEL